jgi:hypothetical protein
LLECGLEEWVTKRVVKKYVKVAFVIVWFVTIVKEVGDHFHQSFKARYNLHKNQGLECLHKGTLQQGCILLLND